MISLYDLKPIGLCLATQDLFDTSRFKRGFGDNILLRERDISLSSKLLEFKKKLSWDPEFLSGYKAVLINNIDKILFLVSAEYSRVDPERVRRIVSDGIKIIEKILEVRSFEKIAEMEGEFKSKITLPVYEIFSKYIKGERI